MINPKFSLGQEFFKVEKFYTFQLEKLKIISIRTYDDGSIKYYYSEYNYFTDSDVEYGFIFLEEKEANKVLLKQLKSLLKDEMKYIQEIKNKIKETENKLKEQEVK
jgi:hypothetical protein